jgi:hypothetical protein
MRRSGLRASFRRGRTLVPDLVSDAADILPIADILSAWDDPERLCARIAEIERDGPGPGNAYMADVVHAKRDKSKHPWAQGEGGIRQWIYHLILEPFCGAGDWGSHHE